MCDYSYINKLLSLQEKDIPFEECKDILHYKYPVIKRGNISRFFKNAEELFPNKIFCYNSQVKYRLPGKYELKNILLKGAKYLKINNHEYPVEFFTNSIEEHSDNEKSFHEGEHRPLYLIGNNHMIYQASQNKNLDIAFILPLIIDGFYIYY